MNTISYNLRNPIPYPIEGVPYNFVRGGSDKSREGSGLKPENQIITAFL